MSDDSSRSVCESSDDYLIECQCQICLNNNDFEITKDLYPSLIDGKIAIFAGAGISTEGSNVIGYSFYDELKHDLGDDVGDLEFPALVSAFCKRPNGRLRLIEKLNSRFSSIRSTPELYWNSTKFHRALAPMRVIDTIITTNWDDFLERECWATPFVFSEDTAFWSAADRRVLKIHGTIENLGSIVASTEDYEICGKRLTSDLIGSRLKVILSEKTVVFCGYSLRDFDFKEIMRFVQSEMNGFHRQAYVVTIDRSEEGRKRFLELGLIPIITDASFFLQKLYEKWSAETCVAPDEMYSAVGDLLSFVREEHSILAEKISMFDHPQVIYSLFYQDGLIHCLERIKLLRKSGEYTDIHRTQSKIHHYIDLKRKAVKRKKYDDAAYIDGYCNGLIFSAAYAQDPEETPPLYFLFKERYFWNFEDFELNLKGSLDQHLPSIKRAQDIAGKYKRNDGMVLDHACRLFGL